MKKIVFSLIFSVSLFADISYFEEGLAYLNMDNYSKAREKFTLAARQGDVRAKNSLGIMYYSGGAGEKNIEKAYRLFKEAADSGHYGAKKNLAFLCKRYPDVCNE